LRPPDFESGASASSATRALFKYYHRPWSSERCTPTRSELHAFVCSIATNLSDSPQPWFLGVFHPARDLGIVVNPNILNLDGRIVPAITKEMIERTNGMHLQVDEKDKTALIRVVDVE
jgi:hypothetical protein